ncbi:hypothetical protein [Bacillus vallismortis]|uniref:hypothetical protein n=1 Tax=Bacillus vallismortis TaxID=72361 RepID=UPI00227FFC28|nr:hypothetical protein [Bacillus vallismortis]MCY7917793.1 hypothetical protein [Bacillus vallismortis]MCY8534296.1 hypothetical protein [Bacillus vallismortis]
MEFGAKSIIVIHDWDGFMYQYHVGADNWGIHSVSIADFDAEPRGVPVSHERVKTNIYVIAKRHRFGGAFFNLLRCI